MRYLIRAAKITQCCLFAAVLLLSACGQNGPLYLPEVEPQEIEPLTIPEAQTQNAPATPPIPEQTKPTQPVQPEQPSI